MGRGDAGMEAAEQVIRTGLLKLGGSMLEQLLAADNGYRGPRVPCGQGHEAALAGYRDKSFDTALGLVTLTRAWYHCAECRHGLAPRDSELGVAGSVCKWLGTAVIGQAVPNIFGRGRPAGADPWAATPGKFLSPAPGHGPCNNFLPSIGHGE